MWKYPIDTLAFRYAEPREQEFNKNTRSAGINIMPSQQDDLLAAIAMALGNEWDAAHRIVQQYEADAVASWIHAVLHKIEGDPENSRYWYRRAGKLDHFADEPRAELIAIRAKITGDLNL
jgi:hypothetical protein